MKLNGKKIETKVYKCRFPEIHAKNKDGVYQIEILVPKEDVKELNAQLYGGNPKLIDFNKVRPTSKLPRSLGNVLYQYDAEAKEYVYDDNDEKVADPDYVIFRFKSQFAPKILFKKGLDKTAKVGYDSMVQIAGKVFANDEKIDDKGKPIPYVLLSLIGVKVHELVIAEGQEAFEKDDDFEEIEETVEEGYEEAEQQEKPTKKQAERKPY